METLLIGSICIGLLFIILAMEKSGMIRMSIEGYKMLFRGEL